MGDVFSKSKLALRKYILNNPDNVKIDLDNMRSLSSGNDIYNYLEQFNNVNDLLYVDNCIRTYSGIYMNIFEPTLDMINIEDIAHALSMQCRFGGHIPKFYSVAQHSVMCSRNVNKKYKLAALMHDASEAYILDIPTPIKSRLTNYKDIEDKLMRLIAEKYNFNYPINNIIKNIDKKMLKFEFQHLMLNSIKHDILCWDQQTAKEIFLQEFNTLTKC